MIFFVSSYSAKIVSSFQSKSFSADQRRGSRLLPSIASPLLRLGILNNDSALGMPSDCIDFAGGASF